MTLDRTRASAEPRVPSACCQSRWLAAHLVGIASPVRESGVMGVIEGMRARARNASGSRWAKTDAVDIPFVWYADACGRMWEVGAGECVRLASTVVPPVQVDRAQRNPPSVERTKRKEEKRREEGRDGNFGWQLYCRRATCGRCDSMAIQVLYLRKRTPHLVEQLQMEMSPTITLQIPSRLPSPCPPKHKTSRQFQSLD